MPNKKNQPTNLEKKREKIYVIETQIIFIFFFLLFKKFQKKETELAMGLNFYCSYQSSKGML